MENKDKELALVKPSDLSLVSDNSLNPKQLKTLLQRTPKKYIKQRPAKGGGKWDYVGGGYIKKCLNIMFGWDWDFEIVDEQVLIEAKEVVVKGRLTCRTNGKKIVKMQYGNKDIIFRKGTDAPLSIGNDMKSAATDCLKKCASEIGIAADVYNKEDFREVKVMTEKNHLSEHEIDKQLNQVKTVDEAFDLWSRLNEIQQNEWNERFQNKQSELS